MTHLKKEVLLSIDTIKYVWFLFLWNEG